MRVAVQGLWHLGSVTAACLAAAGHDVAGFDDDNAAVAGLNRGETPISEPGLRRLIESGLASKRLSFSTDPATALAGAEVLWVTFDTPVNEDDVADVGFVIGKVTKVLPFIALHALVIVSSQLPVGSVAALELVAKQIGRSDLAFVCSPENLRLGKAIDVFSHPDRVVVGVRTDLDADRFRRLMMPITSEIMVMGVESAEMTKHAINSFLAMSVAFANEIASVCEATGADAAEVAAGLRSEQRIGPKAYVGPGAAFAGGTLARDISFLTERGRQGGLALALIPSVSISNDRHRAWALNRIRSILGALDGRTVAILGLTYKAGTDTLRRSASVELARALVRAGASVRAFDPAVRALPKGSDLDIKITESAATAVSGADVVVIGTEWPEFMHFDWPTLLASMSQPIVLDANGAMAKSIGSLPGVTYASVGRVMQSDDGMVP